MYPAVVAANAFYILQNVKYLLSDVNFFFVFFKNLAIFCSQRHFTGR